MVSPKIRTLLLIFFVLSFAIPALSRDFGTHGHLYTIAEPDLLLQITGRLKALEKEGMLARHQKTVLSRAEHSVRNPSPVSGITRTTQSTTRYYDPSITVPYTLRDQTGRVFHKKGTKVNPLHYRSLSAPLVFIDGEDKAQVAWAYETYVKPPHKLRLILVAGSPFELMENWDRFAWNNPIYFDQGGTLCTKLGITRVPTVVSQEGLRLKIEEVVIPEVGR